ncbi:MAG: hypothetical protein KAV87_13710 [Desulfobacteraceae bacterium]|nr:hypothetical protein [Desulfobacteraceae bacterium]
MPENNFERQIIVLFDEQGTPTFGPKRDTDSFLGVAVVYDLEKEKEIFSTCDALFGLTKPKPLKNDRISNSRAERVSDLVIKLPIQIVVKSVNLADGEFHQTMTVYVQLANELRKKHRRVGASNIAQRLYSQILVETVFNSIQDYMKRHLTSSSISVYVDHHCFPREDIGIHLKDWAKGIQADVNSFYEEHGPDLNVRIAPISLMKQDSLRKRFVDIIASVVSRSFLREDSVRFSKVPLQTLLTKDVNRYEDITESSIDFIRGLMDGLSRNPAIH